MDPIANLILATLVFLGAHFVSSTPLRRPLVEAISEHVYLGAYSLISLVTLGWMIWAYAKAPFQPLWQVPGLRLWPLVVMPFALILIAAGGMTRNPTAVMQAAARGDLASLVFFGGFLVLAALGTALIDARKADALGADWKRFADVTSNVPFGAIVNGRNRFRFGEIGWKRVGAGLALYLVLLAAHPYLFGSRPY
jgi:uncharacterized membrane protein